MNKVEDGPSGYLIETNYYYDTKLITYEQYIKLFYKKIFNLYLFTGCEHLKYQIMYKMPELFYSLEYYNLLQNKKHLIDGDIIIMQEEINKISHIYFNIKYPTKLQIYFKHKIIIVCDEHPLIILTDMIIKQAKSIFELRFLELLVNDDIYEWSLETKNNCFGDYFISDNLFENLFTLSEYILQIKLPLLYFMLSFLRQ